MLKTNHQNPNLAMLEFAARKLGPLKDNLVFVGGCTTDLFVTDPAAPKARPTNDVDCIVDVVSLGEYTQLMDKLNELGFKPSMSDITCRWRYDDLILDVIPTKEKILTFSNCWYQPAIEHAVTYQLTGDLAIQTISAPYFLATKLEAFYGRGNGDFLGSHDLEDIVTVIDGRPELSAEIVLADMSLKTYLKKIFSELLENEAFQLALPGH